MDAMQEAYDKLKACRPKNWARMYVIAVVLDPRLKMAYCKLNNWGPRMTAFTRDALLQAINEYGTEYKAPQDDQSNTATCSRSKNKCIENVMKRHCVQKEDELGGYLAAVVAERDVDVLRWWRIHAGEYPCLAHIARDYLAIPATSVPSERAFSCGGDLVSDKRALLDEDTIRASMCLSSWLSVAVDTFLS
jgi:hypothetical protein